MANTLDMRLEVEGAKEVQKMLDELGADMRDLRGAMNAVGNNARSYFSGQVFASRGQAIGQPWQRLSEPYATKKARQFPGRMPLKRTGAMSKSFRHTADNMSVTIYNFDPKFRYHQSTEPRSKIPRRAMIGVSAHLERSTTAIIAKVLAEKIRKKGGK